MRSMQLSRCVWSRISTQLRSSALRGSFSFDAIRGCAERDADFDARCDDPCIVELCIAAWVAEPLDGLLALVLSLDELAFDSEDFMPDDEPEFIFDELIFDEESEFMFEEPEFMSDDEPELAPAVLPLVWLFVPCGFLSEARWLPGDCVSVLFALRFVAPLLRSVAPCVPRLVASLPCLVVPPLMEPDDVDLCEFVMPDWVSFADGPCAAAVAAKAPNMATMIA